ncbi:major facilitator superfamily domain-containing protein [Leucosporidium creatinivorum]|uniref:Major facilitator superfamily domain-containing protein n=1 Tax=Leucosporidium creatinivorum TaxID=106004 RepID=A0A1Y2EY60_9BASI|nr:major facilitator superfamily domain-containing protein [Leucosporidium creatinivorum]
MSPTPTPALSHPHLHPLPVGDSSTFPSLTESGAPTDVYETHTTTGLVAAHELQPEGQLMSGRSSMTHVELGAGGDVEKGSLEGSNKEGKEGESKIVTWKENDPEDPRQFSNFRKWVVTVIATALCFDVGLSSSIITGGLVPVKEHFHSSTEVVNLTVCVFVIGFGVGPLFLSPMSELLGRKFIYLLSMGLFAIFSIPCAVAKSMAVLIVFRFLAGLAASAPMCNAAGSIADCWSVNERGHKMSAFSSILFISPCLGPIFGGYMAMNISWRWIYWFQVIVTGFLFFAVLLFMPETYAPTLLARRAKRLRKETGDQSIMTEQEMKRRPGPEIVREALLRPMVMLVTEPIMAAFSGFLCLVYGLLYGFFFAVPIIFAEGHGFSYGQTGLVFFGILIGIAIIAITGCPAQENYYQRRVIADGGSTVPETRLPMMMGCAITLPISLFIFAWTSNPSTSWVGPAAAGIPFGFSLVGIYISANSYLVDTYTQYGASAMASKTFIRSLAGASVPMWIDYMYGRLGNEWAGSLLAFISLALAPIPFLFYFYGARIRARSAMAT